MDGITTKTWGMHLNTWCARFDTSVKWGRAHSLRIDSVTTRWRKHIDSPHSCFLWKLVADCDLGHLTRLFEEVKHSRKEWRSAGSTSPTLSYDDEPHLTSHGCHFWASLWAYDIFNGPDDGPHTKAPFGMSSEPGPEELFNRRPQPRQLTNLLGGGGRERVCVRNSLMPSHFGLRSQPSNKICTLCLSITCL